MKVNIQSLYKKFLVSTAKTGYLVYSSLLVPPSASKDTTVPWTDRDRLITCCSCPRGHLCYRNTKSTFSTNSSPKCKAAGNLKHRHRSSLVQQSSNLIWTLSHFSQIFSSMVPVHWDGSTKPHIPRTAPSQLLRAVRHFGPTSSLYSWGDEPSSPPDKPPSLNHCLESLQGSPLLTSHLACICSSLCSTKTKLFIIPHTHLEFCC